MKKIRLTRKVMEEWLDRNTVISKRSICGDEIEVRESKIDSSYICHTGQEKKSCGVYIHHGISEQVQNAHGVAEHTANIGFNPKSQKWFGWSHRCIAGFGVGSEVKRGDCAYTPTDKEDFLQDRMRFYGDTDMEDSCKLAVRGEIVAEEQMEWDCERDEEIHTGIIQEGVRVFWTYDDTIPNEKLRGQISSIFEAFPDTWGRGEWKAKTLSDAKQMAIDFADGVS